MPPGKRNHARRVEKTHARAVRRYHAVVLTPLPSRLALQAVAWLGLLLALAAPACRSNGGGTASDARITLRQGAAAEVAFGTRKMELPAGDVGTEAPPLTQDETAMRLAYRTSAGMARILYVVGEGLFLGPVATFPADFRAVPNLDHALGPLFEAAGPRRAELVREVRRVRGDQGVARLLVDAAYVDDPAWEEARRSLPATQQDALRDGLASGLEPGKSVALLRHAVRLVDLKAPARAKVVATRARELAARGEDPRAVAALLRAVIATDKAKAAEIGCEVLAKRPTTKSGVAEHASLVEAATLAIASADATCPDAKLVESVLVDSCSPYYRCNDSGPVSWSDTSKQDEPLCTRAQLDKVLAAELARAPREVLDGGPTRPGLWAYASLAAKGTLPQAFTVAQDRRRYALSQPAEPACDTALAPGTACHCDEATVRLFACKEPTSAKVNVGVCRFDVDDKQKKILNVVATPPP
jgi:hypothetical protein